MSNRIPDNFMAVKGFDVDNLLIVNSNATGDDGADDATAAVDHLEVNVVESPDEEILFHYVDAYESATRLTVRFEPIRLPFDSAFIRDRLKTKYANYDRTKIVELTLINVDIDRLNIEEEFPNLERLILESCKGYWIIHSKLKHLIVTNVPYEPVFGCVDNAVDNTVGAYDWLNADEKARVSCGGELFLDGCASLETVTSKRCRIRVNDHLPNLKILAVEDATYNPSSMAYTTFYVMDTQFPKLKELRYTQSPATSETSPPPNAPIFINSTTVEIVELHGCFVEDVCVEALKELSARDCTFTDVWYFGSVLDRLTLERCSFVNAFVNLALCANRVKSLILTDVRIIAEHDDDTTVPIKIALDEAIELIFDADHTSRQRDLYTMEIAFISTRELRKLTLKNLTENSAEALFRYADLYGVSFLRFDACSPSADFIDRFQTVERLLFGNNCELPTEIAAREDLVYVEIFNHYQTIAGTTEIRDCPELTHIVANDCVFRTPDSLKMVNLKSLSHLIFTDVYYFVDSSSVDAAFLKIDNGEIKSEKLKFIYFVNNDAENNPAISARKSTIKVNLGGHPLKSVVAYNVNISVE